MTLLLVNIVLALAWAAVTGSFSLTNLLFGFVLGAFALYLIREQVGTTGYFDRVFRIIALAILFLRELVVSAVRVFLLVIRPNLKLEPGIIAYPLKVDRDFEITLLANMITLTPGTLSVDISRDRRLLYVHSIDARDPDEIKRDIASGFERKIMEAFR